MAPNRTPAYVSNIVSELRNRSGPHILQQCINSSTDLHPDSRNILDSNSAVPDMDSKVPMINARAARTGGATPLVMLMLLPRLVVNDDDDDDDDTDDNVDDAADVDDSWSVRR